MAAASSCHLRMSNVTECFQPSSPQNGECKVSEHIVGAVPKMIKRRAPGEEYDLGKAFAKLQRWALHHGRRHVHKLLNYGKANKRGSQFTQRSVQPAVSKRLAIVITDLTPIARKALSRLVTNLSKTKETAGLPQ